MARSTAKVTVTVGVRALLADLGVVRAGASVAPRSLTPMAAPPLPSSGLPTAVELLEVHAHLEGLLQAMRARASKNNAASDPSDAEAAPRGRQGRYKKVDTARKSFIQGVALPGLKLGKLPSEADWNMLFGPHDDDLEGAARTAAYKWASLHHRDPRSTAPLPEADSERQKTLLEWVERNPDAFMKPSQAPVGAPLEARLDFGKFMGRTVFDLIRDGTTGRLVPGAGSGALYLRWICSSDFNWSFPRHLPLLVSLIRYKDRPVANHDGGIEPLDLSHAIEAYKAYAEPVISAAAGADRCR